MQKEDSDEVRYVRLVEREAVVPYGSGTGSQQSIFARGLHEIIPVDGLRDFTK